MARTLTASDRRSLIRLASTLPKGSPERKAILAGLADSASRGNFKKDALAALPSLKDEVEEAMKAFAEAQVASWDSSADATDEKTRAEDLEAWFNELDMAVDAIKAWKRNLMKALK